MAIKVGTTAFDLIMRYARKRLASPNAEGIMEVMSNKQAMDFVKDLVEEFNRFGVPESAITVVDDVGKFANQIMDLKQQQIMQAFKKQITPKKSAQVFDLQGNKIDTSKGIMAGRQIDQTDDEATKALQDKLAKDKGYQKYRGETEEQIKERFKKQNKESIERFKKNMDDLEDKAEGGRIGYKIGSIDKARRAFLKTVGTAGAGLAALKSGILGFGKEAAPVVEKAVETVSETAQNVPPYFLNLVNKIKNLGKKFDGPKERSESFTYKDYEMDIDYDTGAIEIKKTKEAMIPGGDEAGISEEVYMTYKPGMADETTKGKKVADEYEEFTARPDMDGKMKDVDEGVPDEVIEEGTMFEDNMTEFGKASGGIARMLGE